MTSGRHVRLRCRASVTSMVSSEMDVVVTACQAWASAHTPRHGAVHRRGTAASNGAWRAKGRGFALGDGGRARWRPGAQTTEDDDPRDQAGDRKRLRLARIAVIVIDA